jgi:hypothetical protein
MGRDRLNAIISRCHWCLCPAEDLGLRATPLVLRRSAGMIAIRGAAPKLSLAEILMINQ